jgi:hypothetical protein
MAPFITRRRYLVALVVVAFVVTLVFGGRAAWRLAHRLAGPPPPPRQTDVSAIAGWMTVPYIGRTYRVPPPELYRALGISPDGHRTSSLDDIAGETGRPPGEVLDTVRATVEAWQQANPPPDRGAPKPGAPKPERPSG